MWNPLVEEFACRWGTGLGAFRHCWADRNFCQTEDPCDGPVVYLEAPLSSALISEIGGVHPRVAATLWATVRDGSIAGDGTTSWADGPMTAEDVESFVESGTMELGRASGDPVVYRHYLDQDPATGQWRLVIVPQKASELDPPFSVFILELKASDTGVFTAGEWSLF